MVEFVTSESEGPIRMRGRSIKEYRQGYASAPPVFTVHNLFSCSIVGSWPFPLGRFGLLDGMA